MTSPTWRRALVLGGTRSGKSEFAEALLSGAIAVRYVATGRRDKADTEWDRRIDAHRARRPAHWSTVEIGDDPWRLPAVLTDAATDDVLLVDELGTWVGAVMSITGDDTDPPVERMRTELGAAVGACRGTLVLVSPEVGLAPVALTPAGRRFVDALGATNIGVAAACDAVVLVIAGNAVPVKGGL
jgi:adenosyl cobinamide kinase/adenosyl cobinamide phosphate guanylyltransferase